jgi:hypothetical protein
MLGLMERQREIHFFYVEIKRPAISSKLQVEDDFVKLSEAYEKCSWQADWTEDEEPPIDGNIGRR